MKVYNPLSCRRPDFASVESDLILTTATAYEIVSPYPVDFGKPPEVTIQVDKEFSVLADWQGNVLSDTL
jgi:hypothetical protein